ncbi:hypothetical protein [Burkholderia ubonensis]|uniref:hypothetical protein n=1 Tax=Burkholderia ubonensis TaxID=101571 RepID=UPI00076DBA3B|nr:hypothetical protein [Burkholderia ubonensis]KVV07482.1 hypothetical protein WK77_16990 [Burkholderia ubonensis]
MNQLTYRCVSTDAIVDDVPVTAVWIDGEDHELLDAIRMRCTTTALRFIEAARVAGFVAASEVTSGEVWVTVDRSDYDQRGDVNVETQTDIFTFEPVDRHRASGPSYATVKGLDFLDDE